MKIFMNYWKFKLLLGEDKEYCTVIYDYES